MTIAYALTAIAQWAALLGPAASAAGVDVAWWRLMADAALDAAREGEC